METEEAINTIKKQIAQLPTLKNYYRLKSKESAKWLLDTLFILEDIFGKNSDIVTAFKNAEFEHNDSFEYEVGRREASKNFLDLIAFKKGCDVVQGVLESGIDLLRRKGVDAVYEGKDSPKEASEILKVVSLIENCLSKSIKKKPEKEKDVQDVLEILFIGAGLEKEYTREKERILYSSKTYQPDFVFPKINAVVEVKFCDRVEREKELIGEINDYMVAFQTKYANLVFVVYDIGIIRDPEKFKESFEKQNSVVVKVIKH